jgi:hypothetical protein
MAEEIKRFNFNDIAANLGYVAEAEPPRPASGGDPHKDPDAIRRNSLRFQKMWPKDRAMKLLHYFDDFVESGAPIEFEGHSICWAMIALQQRLRNNRVLMYMPPFGKSLEMLPLRRVAQPKDNPMMQFDITEQGNDVRIVVTLLNGGSPDPFQVSLGDVEIQEIGPGKNIWLELVGGHYLFMFAFPKTFGGDCNTMYYKEGGADWYCVVSNDPTVQVGSQPDSCPIQA